MRSDSFFAAESFRRGLLGFIARKLTLWLLERIKNNVEPEWPHEMSGNKSRSGYESSIVYGGGNA